MWGVGTTSHIENSWSRPTVLGEPRRIPYFLKMPDAITLGPLAVPPGLLTLVIAVTATLIFISYVVPRLTSATEAEQIARVVTRALLLAFITWKLWPLFGWWQDVVAQPTMLLRVPGGRGGLVAGIIVAASVIAHALYRRRITVKPVAMTGTVGLVLFFFTTAVVSAVGGQPDPFDPSELAGELSRIEFLDKNGSTRVHGDITLERPVVLTFWATWCGPCRAELPIKHRFYRENNESVDYIAVNMTRSERSVETISRFVEENEMVYPIALDTEGRLASIFGVRGTPTTVVVATDGTVSDRWMGASPLDRLNRAVQTLP